MKFLSIPTVMALLISSAAAHSWLHCVDTCVENKEYAEEHPSETLVQTCNGHPNNQTHYDDWIWESSYYAYNFTTEYACKANQRTPGATATGAPMATVTPGQQLTMKYWGNGHSLYRLASPANRDCGLVRIYWAGKPDTPIVYAKDLNERTWIKGAQQNFTADAVIELIDDGHRMNEKANYFVFTVPDDIQNGLQSMVWAWAWKASMVEGTSGESDVYDHSWDNAWGTCFDLHVTGGSTDKEKTSKAIAGDSYNDKEDEDLHNEICNQTCYLAGMTEYTDASKPAPPCRNKNAGKTNCYAYGADGKCPFPGDYDCNAKYKKRDLAGHHHARRHRRGL